MELRRHKLAILVIMAIFSFSLSGEIFSSLLNDCSNSSKKCSCTSGCCCDDDMSIEQLLCYSADCGESLPAVPSVIREFTIRLLPKSYSAQTGIIVAGTEIEKPVSNYSTEYILIPTKNSTYKILSQYRSPPII